MAAELAVFGDIRTMDPERPSATALAVAGGLIVAREIFRLLVDP
jgi:predicted amidohydrolase YtcJ